MSTTFLKDFNLWAAWRIPIYSAYVLKSPNIGRCDAWYIEPQLDNTNAQHTNNHLSMLATSTLTNATPQDQTFNRGKWKEHEKAVIDDLQSCDEAYVVTGVVPDTNKKIPISKPRVTVSKYYWRATCCKQGSTFIGKGYFGPDNNGKVQSLPITGPTGLQQKLIND
ncbi:endonuclease domain-containing 1 -like protein [Labeo rohita]|uniref:Endonuclease domain-containing 1-like protein n=1 Tax=Labeo rohita TaxID=84645 RepID=A0A498P332_LABRO|nr:endonuclease domain-containing 1 -like protein [Labeo rohita]RXN38179.1 endonuclease domain-containing 1 -like protein [Labeo rohita]